MDTARQTIYIFNVIILEKRDRDRIEEGHGRYCWKSGSKVQKLKSFRMKLNIQVDEIGKKSFKRRM
jgi:hypothetical protein